MPTVIARRENVRHRRMVLEARQLRTVLKGALRPGVSRIGAHVVQDDATILAGGSRRHEQVRGIVERAYSRGTEEQSIVFGVARYRTKAILSYFSAATHCDE